MMSGHDAAASGRRHLELSQAYLWCSRLISVAALVGSALAFMSPDSVPTAWILVAFSCICAAAAVAWKFPRNVEVATVRSNLAWVGAVFFVVAATSDIAATLWHSPTLDEEANLLVRPLLSRLSLSWILAGAGIFQLAFLSLSISLWCNLLARWPWYLREVKARGRIPLWLAMIGVRGGSWSRLLMLGRHVDLGLAACAFYLPWAYVGRVYLAMEWMGWVPISRWVLPIALFACAFFCQWFIVRRALAAE